MKSRFKNEDFEGEILEKMFSEMAKQKRRIGVRELAKEVGISAATFSRVNNGNPPDLETFFKFCFWMGKNPNDFYNKNKTLRTPKKFTTKK